MNVFKSYYVHASYSFSQLTPKNYIFALRDLLLARLTNPKNITFHFPLEIMFASMINIKKGNSYVEWVEAVAKKLGVLVVWENIAFLNEKDWSLKEQAIWKYIPKNVSLCLDTGHIILGEKNPKKKILQIVGKYGKRIKHLHLHENDLIHDLHLPPGKILKPLMKYLTKGRTWIIEPPS